MLLLPHSAAVRGYKAPSARGKLFLLLHHSDMSPSLPNLLATPHFEITMATLGPRQYCGQLNLLMPQQMPRSKSLREEGAQANAADKAAFGLIVVKETHRRSTVTYRQN